MLSDATEVVSDAMLWREVGGEGIRTSLGTSFRRGCCPDFVTLAGLGAEGRPARLVALYSQLRRLLWQRVQVGFCLVHLTFAAAQALQLSRSLGALGAMDDGFAPATTAAPVSAASVRVRMRFAEALPDPVRPGVLGVVVTLGE